MDLKTLRIEAEKNYIPILREDTEKILIKTLEKEQPKNILEIGTAIGYSGTIILQNSNSKLTTIELNKDRYEFAKNVFKNFNLENRVNQILGDANEILPTIKEKYDFIFLDGPKGQYLKELPYLFDILSENGTLFADNIYYHGWVKGNEYPKHKHRTAILRLRKFIEECKLKFPTINLYDDGDGILIAKKQQTKN